MMKELKCNSCSMDTRGNTTLFLSCDNCGKVAVGDDTKEYTPVQINIRGSIENRDYCGECMPNVRTLLNFAGGH